MIELVEMLKKGETNEFVVKVLEDKYNGRAFGWEMAMNEQHGVVVKDEAGDEVVVVIDRSEGDLRVYEKQEYLDELANELGVTEDDVDWGE